MGKLATLAVRIASIILWLYLACANSLRAIGSAVRAITLLISNMQLRFSVRVILEALDDEIGDDQRQESECKNHNDSALVYKFHHR